MRQLKLGFTTFLKACATPTRGKIGQVRKFTGKGGYDFYKVMKIVAADLASKRISFEQAKERVARISKESERIHTLTAIAKLNSWLEKFKPQWIEPRADEFISESELLNIQLKPELAFLDRAGKVHSMYLWNLESPSMTKELAGEGLCLLVDQMGEFAEQFEILNLRGGKVITEQAISLASRPQLKHDLMLIEEIWKDVNTNSMSPEKTLAHIMSLG